MNLFYRPPVGLISHPSFEKPGPLRCSGPIRTPSFGAVKLASAQATQIAAVTVPVGVNQFKNLNQVFTQVAERFEAIEVHKNVDILDVGRKERNRRLWEWKLGTSDAIHNESLNVAARQAGIIGPQESIDTLEMAHGYQSAVFRTKGLRKQNGGFGVPHIIFKHGPPIIHLDDYKIDHSRFFDHLERTYASPEQMARWVSETLTKGKVSAWGIQTDGRADKRLYYTVTLERTFRSPIGIRYETYFDRTTQQREIRRQRNHQGEVKLYKMRVVLAFDPRPGHRNKVRLKTAYPT